MSLLEGKELKNYCLDAAVVAVDEARAQKEALDLDLDTTVEMISNLHGCFDVNITAFMVKGNKQAGLRARKCTKSLSTLGKHLRAITV